MSFPARRQFKRDRRRNLAHIRVYEFLEDELDHLAPIEVKLAWIAHGTGMHEQHISQALRHLVEWGYLADHRTDKRAPRLLTLVRVFPVVNKAA